MTPRGSNGSRIGRNMPEQWSLCVLLTTAALFVHGYHPYAEDAGIYVPAIKKLLDPSLYPSGADFFLLPARWSIFPNFIAFSARASHTPLTYLLLFWYVVCLFLVIVACWKLAQICFGNWQSGLIGGSVVAMAASMPAAGSSLLLVDPYLTARSFSTPLILLSLIYVLKRKNVPAALLWTLALLFHPLMALVGAVFLVLLMTARSPKRDSRLLLLIAAGLPIFGAFTRLLRTAATADYRSAVATRSYFFLSEWRWYEILGALAPLGIFAWIALHSRKREHRLLYQVSWAATWFGILATVSALAVVWVPGLYAFARFQPMRAFQLIYLLWLVVPVNWGLQRLTAGLTPRSRELAFAALLIVFGASMYASQKRTFPSSSHIEWPWSTSHNAWQQAFAWIRLNTPKDAVFALDADYADDAGNDRQGFRASAERSALPDRAKDGGVAALFPQLAHEWNSSVQLTAAIDRLTVDNRDRLLAAGATWVVVRSGASPLLDCPYSNNKVAVCRLIQLPNSARLKPSASETR